MSLALKYEVDALRNEIVHQLSSSWPRTIEDWDTSEKKRKMLRKDAPQPNPVMAIRMARILDMPEILPLAHYCTIQLYAKRPPDTEGAGDEAQHDHAIEDQTMTHLLDCQDHAALTLGKEAMAVWVSKHAGLEFRTWRCHLGVVSTCRQHIHLRWIEVLEDVIARRDVLEILSKHTSWGNGTFRGNLCSDCLAEYVEIMCDIRKEFFDNLPKIFGLRQSLR
jgi:hypothetical protein